MRTADDHTFFRLNEGLLSIDRRQQAHVRFLAKDADPHQAHITLISGANGTSKSRMLASIVESIRSRASSEGISEKRERSPTDSDGLHWSDLRTLGNVPAPEQLHLDGPLPSRTLAISTIVMDKFPYTRGRSEKEDYFYYYLGARQASNAVMIGAMGRAMADALVNLLPDPDRFDTFLEWTDLVFGRSCDIALEFDRLSRRQIERFMLDDDQEAFIRNRLDSKRQRAGRSEVAAEEVQRIVESTKQFFQLLLQYGEESESSTVRPSGRSGLVLTLSQRNQNMAQGLEAIWSSLSDLSKAGFSPIPNVLVKLEEWMDFNSLSSGEQNILSTGAKLIAYSVPGCLILIDEPEVSLNVSWQQKYVGLVIRSLEHAPGSHVLIATHSPHLVANLPRGMATVLIISKTDNVLEFSTEPAEFEGWGSETVLYEVLGIPSASSFLFNREIASVLEHIQDGGRDSQRLDEFLAKADTIQTSEVEPLEELLQAIREYRDQLG